VNLLTPQYTQAMHERSHRANEMDLLGLGAISQRRRKYLPKDA